MSFWPTLIGAAFGLGIALIANLVILPMVLRSQAEHGTTKLPKPFDSLDSERATRFIYRFVMPVLFAVTTAIAANHILGEGFAP